MMTLQQHRQTKPSNLFLLLLLLPAFSSMVSAKRLIRGQQEEPTRIQNDNRHQRILVQQAATASPAASPRGAVRMIEGLVYQDTCCLMRSSRYYKYAPNVEVQLLTQGGGMLVDTTLTGDNGYYMFYPVPPSEYTVSVGDLEPPLVRGYNSSGHDTSKIENVDVTEEDAIDQNPVIMIGRNISGSVLRLVDQGLMGNQTYYETVPDFEIELQHDGSMSWTTVTDEGGQYYFYPVPVYRQPYTVVGPELSSSPDYYSMDTDGGQLGKIEDVNVMYEDVDDLLFVIVNGTIEY